MQYVASISYGKDSLAMLHVIKDILHKPLDRIVTAEVWATDTIQADLPPMVEFKDKADKIILERWGIRVERYCATEQDGSKLTYEKGFYHVHQNSKHDYKNGHIWGFPYLRGPWCNNYLKVGALNRIKQSKSGKTVDYLGIAADEGKRVERHKSREGIALPLVDAGWTEAMCRKWCEDNGLLSPLYATSNRGGCWFCHNQSNEQLRMLRKQYPDLWAKLLEWDTDAPDYAKFKPGFTVHDYDRRLQLEDEGYYNYSGFKWDSLKAVQMNIDQFL